MYRAFRLLGGVHCKHGLRLLGGGEAGRALLAESKQIAPTPRALLAESKQIAISAKSYFRQPRDKMHGGGGGREGGWGGEGAGPG